MSLNIKMADVKSQATSVKGNMSRHICATVKICIKEVIKAGKKTHFEETQKFSVS
jgi:macrodomain Ter protein organizer (MatP/YcbG family)